MLTPDGDSVTMAVEQFEHELEDFRALAECGDLDEKHLKYAYVSLLESQANKMRVLMPNIVTALGNRLAYVSPERREHDRIVMKRKVTMEELKRMDALSQETWGEEKWKCDIAQLMGFLGRDAANPTVDLLLDAVPLPERDDDDCVMRALIRMGPVAYEAIVSRVLEETSLNRVYVGTMAVVIQARDTDFVDRAKLGVVDQWDQTVPRSMRKLRRLARDWRDWWDDNAQLYDWDSEKRRLVLKE